MAENSIYIWQRPDWREWRYQIENLSEILAKAHYEHGRLLGRMQDLGVDSQQEADLQTLTQDVLKTSEIEGERLDVQSVRSSLARRLGMDIGGLTAADRHVDGVVEMVLDATRHCHADVDAARLFGWHAALFPTGYSGLAKIAVGQYRDDRDGAMQVVSGRFGREKVHFQAPPAAIVADEMAVFFDWLREGDAQDAFVKAGIAHLWFLTLHPFEDGNGRIARAIADLLLARADAVPHRFYSLSSQICHVRAAYYAVLEKTQKGDGTIDEWLAWFIQTLLDAVLAAHEKLDAVLFKARCWQRWRDIPLNERQIKVLNRLLDGFEGQLNNRKWVAMTGCSRDTALRDINDLLDKGILQKSESGGRSVFYCLVGD